MQEDSLWPDKIKVALLRHGAGAPAEELVSLPVFPHWQVEPPAGIARLGRDPGGNPFPGGRLGVSPVAAAGGSATVGPEDMRRRRRPRGARDTSGHLPSDPPRGTELPGAWSGQQHRAMMPEQPLSGSDSGICQQTPNLPIQNVRIAFRPL
eukprot:CAMPEP_0177625026 /NCGR_PEP_ID=MMETSP0419_2-20121207/29849_1 /TAXON_ID=582737 /ORGANISM="Tetraselmis sp., Strain GSL018" /LENGTH=150 /DNA_ID=CAMNT_0019125883 /DNA_START=554 /DNA_END=1007 /DNA_ORIENTATION=+